MVVLWLIFFQHNKSEIDVLIREQQGLELTQIVLPLIYDSTAALSAVDTAEITRLEALLAIEPESRIVLLNQERTSGTSANGDSVPA